MTYNELVEILFSFGFIHLIEACFIVMFTLFNMGKKASITEALSTIVPIAIISHILFYHGENSLAIKGVVFAVIWMVLNLKYHSDRKQMAEITGYVLLASVIMLIVELLCFVPYLFIFGTDLEILTENIYITIALSIPTRVFEYIILYILYLRKVDEDVQENH